MIATPRGQLLADYLLALERRLPSMGSDDLPAVRRGLMARPAGAGVLPRTLDEFLRATA